jgi:glutathione S-transferase
MKFYGDLLKKHGGKFLCGDKPTIADFAVFAELTSFQMGYLDHVPKTCIDKYTDIIVWMKRVGEIPQIQDYMNQK